MTDFAAVRDQFPALNIRRDGRTPIYLDGPGGTQVPQRVLDAIVHYLSTCNANHGGVFTTSRESDAILHEAHQAAADLLNAPSPDEVTMPLADSDVPAAHGLFSFRTVGPWS